MQLGCISWSYRLEFDAGKFDFSSWMVHCRGEGRLDGVELWNRHFASLREDYLETILQTSRRLGLAIYSVATKCEFGTFTPQEIEGAKQTLRTWLRVARRLNSPILRSSIGGADLRRVGRRDAVFRAFTEVLRSGEAAGTEVGIENQEPGLVENAVDVRLMREGTDGLVKLILDNGSFIDKSGGYDFMEHTLADAALVHAKFFDVDQDGEDRVLSYRRIIPLLKSRGYDGFLSIEYAGEQPASIVVPKAAAFLRGLIARP